MIEILKAKLQELNNLSQSLKDQLEQLRQQLNDRSNLPSLFDSGSESTDYDLFLSDDEISEQSFPDTISNHSHSNDDSVSRNDRNNDSSATNRTGTSQTARDQTETGTNTAGNDDGADVVEQVERTVVNSLFELSSRLERVRNQMRAVLNSGLVQEQNNLNDEVRLPSVTLDSIVRRHRNSNIPETEQRASISATVTSNAAASQPMSYFYQYSQSGNSPVASVRSDSEPASPQSREQSPEGDNGSASVYDNLGVEENDNRNWTQSDSNETDYESSTQPRLSQSHNSSHVIVHSPPSSPTLSWLSDSSSSIPTISSRAASPQLDDIYREMSETFSPSSSESSSLSSVASMASTNVSPQQSPVSNRTYSNPTSPAPLEENNWSVDPGTSDTCSDNNDIFDNSSNYSVHSWENTTGFEGDDNQTHSDGEFARYSKVHFTIGTPDSEKSDDSNSGNENRGQQHDDDVSSKNTEETQKPSRSETVPRNQKQPGTNSSSNGPGRNTDPYTCDTQCEPDSTQSGSRSRAMQSSTSDSKHSPMCSYLSDSSESDQSVKYLTRRLKPTDNRQKKELSTIQSTGNSANTAALSSENTSQPSQTRHYSFRKRHVNETDAGNASGPKRFKPDDRANQRYSPNRSSPRIKSAVREKYSNSNKKGGHKRTSTVQSDSVQPETSGQGQSLNVKIDLSLINYSGHLASDPCTSVPSATVMHGSANISPAHYSSSSRHNHKSSYRQTCSSQRKKPSPNTNRMESASVNKKSSTTKTTSSSPARSSSANTNPNQNLPYFSGGQTNSDHDSNDSDTSTDATWEPCSDGEETDITVTEEDECETDSSYEVQVPKSAAALLEEYASDSSDASWSQC